MSLQARRYRKPDRNYHHLTPRVRHGKDTYDNLLFIHAERHEYWHKIFGLLTLEEAIALLQRLKRMKERSHGTLL